MNASRITLNRGVFKGWKTWHIRRDPLELVLLPEVGGRIMGMLWHGHDLYFTNPAREGRIENVAAVSDLHAKKRAMGFPLWGGDKTWLAPQTRWTDAVPFLDLDSGSYELSVDDETASKVCLSMTSPLCRETGTRLTRTITLSSDHEDWTVKHRLTNASGSDICWALWDVTMVRKPGIVYLPRCKTSQFDGGVKTFVEEGESKSVRAAVLKEMGNLAAIHCQGGQAFKFGVDSEEAWILSVIDIAGPGLVGYRKQVPVFRNEEYGHGCTSEVYNSDRFPYFEMEIHGPLVQLKPGQSFELEERQVLFDITQRPATEEELRQMIPV